MTTDPPTPADPVRPSDDDPASLTADELASAYLDDALADPTPVEEDADLLARVAVFAAVREAVATPPVPLERDERAALLAGALHRADRAPAARRRVWLPHPAVAAAVVLIIAVTGIGLIVAGLTHHHAKDTSLSASADVPTVVIPKGSSKSIPDLGDFADQATVTQAIRTLSNQLLPMPGVAAAANTPIEVPAAASAGGARATTTAPPSTDVKPLANGTTYKTNTTELNRCEQVIEATDSTLESRTAVIAATIARRVVLIYSNPVTPTTAGAAPHTRITVTDAVSCSILFAIDRTGQG